LRRHRVSRAVESVTELVRDASGRGTDILRSKHWRTIMGTTANVWRFQDMLSRDLGSIDRLVGYDVEATDGHIGKIDEASAETDRQYLVVDTGFWIFGKKRLIPAGVATRVDHDDRNVFVSMTKDQIKQAPDFDDVSASEKDVYYDKVGSYYSHYGS
jgi:hypothetical protein